MCAYLGCHNVTILDALDLVPVCRIYSGLTRKTVDSNKVSGISVVAARKSCKYFKWSCVCCDVFHCSAPVASVVACCSLSNGPIGSPSGRQPGKHGHQYHLLEHAFSSKTSNDPYDSPVSSSMNW